MPRVASDVRLRHIAAAGAASFGRLGYRRTRMAEVAVDAQVSTGSIYTYVDSKEALFHVVLALGFGAPVESLGELPIAGPGLEATVEMVSAELRRHGVTPLLKAATESAPPADIGAELAAIVGEQYATVHELRGVLSVIESCAADIPSLESMYFGRRRRGRIDLLLTYLRRRAEEGCIATFPDMAVAAQIVTEAVAWFAWKRFEGHDAPRFDDSLAQRTVVEFVCNALVPRAGVA